MYTTERKVLLEQIELDTRDAISPEELGEVCGDREVRVSLLRLLPLQLDPG